MGMDHLKTAKDFAEYLAGARTSTEKVRYVDIFQQAMNVARGLALAQQAASVRQALLRTRAIVLQENAKGLFSADFCMCIERAISSLDKPDEKHHA